MWPSLTVFYKRLQTVWYVLGVAAALTVGGYVFKGYADSFASKGDIVTLTGAAASSDSRIHVLEEMRKRDEEDRKIMQQQIFEIARSVGAPIVPGLRERVETSR